MLLGMLGWITPFLIVSSYALLLVAAQILGAQLNFIGFMALVLGWFAVANWSTWSFTDRAWHAQSPGSALSAWSAHR